MAGNRNEEMVYCSFCGKNQEEVKKIIAGNGVLSVTNVWPCHKKSFVRKRLKKF